MSNSSRASNRRIGQVVDQRRGLPQRSPCDLSVSNNKSTRARLFAKVPSRFVSGISAAALSALANTSSPDRAIVITAASPPLSAGAPRRDLRRDPTPASPSSGSVVAVLRAARREFASREVSIQQITGGTAHSAVCSPQSKGTLEFYPGLLATLILAPDPPTPRAVAQRLGAHPIRPQRNPSPSQWNVSEIQESIRFRDRRCVDARSPFESILGSPFVAGRSFSRIATQALLNRVGNPWRSAAASDRSPTSEETR